MITLELVKRIWQIIEPTETDQTAPAQELEQILLDAGHPLMAADSKFQRHLLIPIKPKSRVFEDKDSGGVHILASVWVDSGKKKNFIDVVCLKPHLNELFDLMVFDILSAIEIDPTNPNRICVNVMNKWRELVRREASKLPDMESIIGLFGELFILQKLTDIDNNAVNIWTGPNGGRFDFYNGKTALEVKSSIQKKGRIVEIHGHTQLEEPKDGNLFLVFLKLEETPVEGESLPDQIQKLVNSGCNQTKLLSKLAMKNIDPQIFPGLEEMKFRIQEERIYLVDLSFPQITNSSFVNGKLPNGIIGVDYQIDLSSEPPMPLGLIETDHVFRILTGGDNL